LKRKTRGLLFFSWRLSKGDLYWSSEGERQKGEERIKGEPYLWAKDSRSARRERS